MAGEGLLRTQCPHCEKRIGIRRDQMGRRLRCPGCRHAFSVDLGPEPGPSATHEFNQSETAEEPWIPAADANEIAFAPPPPKQAWIKPKITASYQRSRPLLFQAAVQAVRSGRCEIVAIDWANAHLRFSLTLPAGGTSQHDLFVFDAINGTSEVDISSQAVNEEGQFDLYYQGIVREIGKYLMFAADPHPVPPPVQPLSLPQPRDEFERPMRRRRYRRHEGSHGLSIAGFVCALVGVCLFCIPVFGGLLGVLGIVFGAIGMGQKEGSKDNFAIASLVLGLIACAFSFVFFLLLVARP